MIHAIRLGTCGWSYKDWAGVFYPPGLPAAVRHSDRPQERPAKVGAGRNVMEMFTDGAG